MKVLIYDNITNEFFVGESKRESETAERFAVRAEYGDIEQDECLLDSQVAGLCFPYDFELDDKEKKIYALDGYRRRTKVLAEYDVGFDAGKLHSDEY